MNYKDSKLKKIINSKQSHILLLIMWISFLFYNIYKMFNDYSGGRVVVLVLILFMIFILLFEVKSKFFVKVTRKIP